MANPAVAAATAANYGRLQKMPCVPITPFPWLNGKMNLIINGSPALLSTSKCACSWSVGRLIEVADPGQNSVYVGGPMNITINEPTLETQQALGRGLLSSQDGVASSSQALQSSSSATQSSSSSSSPSASSQGQPSSSSSASQSSSSQAPQSTEAKPKDIEGSKDICPSCGKKHIDLRVADGERKAVEWETQFDKKFGDAKKQGISCLDACKLILENAGLSKNFARSDTAYQVANEIENINEVDQGNQEKYLQIDKEKAQEGLTYMDQQLEQYHPVVVGVDHTYKYGKNKDKVDHFVVIVGRGCENGKIYYLFYDVGTKQPDYVKSDKNKLSFHEEDFSLRGSTAYNGKKYVVTQIRKNE